MAEAETPKERSNRQLMELFNELRVVLPGAQVLLGFLLTVPFATRWGRVNHAEKGVFFASLFSSGLGIVLLIAPPVYHRLRWESGGKTDVIHKGHVFFLAGTACLAVGIVCAIFLVTDVLFGTAAAAVSAGLIGAVVVGTWYVLPLTRSRSQRVRELE